MELEYSRRPDFPIECSCKTLKTMGYPCGHYLQQCRLSGTPVPLSQVHRHWHFEPSNLEQRQPSPELAIREPALPLPRRREQCDQHSSNAEDSSDEEVSDVVDEEDNESSSLVAADIERPTLTEREHEALTLRMSQGGRTRSGPVQGSTRRSGKTKIIYNYIYMLTN